MMQLYGFSKSRSDRVHWALEEIEQPYEFYQMDFSKGQQTSEAYLKINPCAKVPALVDGEFTLWESGAICNYLGEKYPEKGLTPKSGTHERAQYDQWMLYVLTELEQPLWTKARHKNLYPEDKKVPKIIDTAAWEFERAAKVLHKELQGKEFIVGNRFTMADIFVTHTLRWAGFAKMNLNSPVLENYLANHIKRPAIKRMESKTKTPFA